MQWEYAIDAGSEHMRLCTRASMNTESSYAATRSPKDAYIAWGDRALGIYGREPAGVRVIKPVNGGQLTDIPLLVNWVKRLTDDTQKRILKKNGLLLCVSPAARPEAVRYAQRALIESGICRVGLVRSDVACALGAGLAALAPEASAIVDIGAEQVTASIISGGRVARFEALNYGCARIDEDIMRALREDMGCAVGPRTAREIKHELGFAYGGSELVRTSKAVLDFQSSLPRMREIKAELIAPCVEDVVYELTRLCARLVRFAPEELAADLTRVGLVLAGGGAKLFGLDRRIHRELALPVKVAEEPEDCAIKGMRAILADPKRYSPLIYGRMEEARQP